LSAAATFSCSSSVNPNLAPEITKSARIKEKQRELHHKGYGWTEKHIKVCGKIVAMFKV